MDTTHNHFYLTTTSDRCPSSSLLSRACSLRYLAFNHNAETVLCDEASLTDESAIIARVRLPSSISHSGPDKANAGGSALREIDRLNGSVLDFEREGCQLMLLSTVVAELIWVSAQFTLNDLDTRWGEDEERVARREVGYKETVGRAIDGVADGASFRGMLRGPRCCVCGAQLRMTIIE